MDVQNPLLGLRGATRVYGPQKGLCPGDFALAETCLRRLVSVVKKASGDDFSRVAGSGAAGGLGYGLLTFLGARLEAGFDLFARKAKMSQRLHQTDLFITGEGNIDQSTMMGKGVGEIAWRCAHAKTPCIGLAGTLTVPMRPEAFASVRALTELTTSKQARAQAAFWLKRLAYQVALDCSIEREESRWRRMRVQSFNKS